MQRRETFQRHNLNEPEVSVLWHSLRSLNAIDYLSNLYYFPWPPRQTGLFCYPISSQSDICVLILPASLNAQRSFGPVYSIVTFFRCQQSEGKKEGREHTDWKRILTWPTLMPYQFKIYSYGPTLMPYQLKSDRTFSGHEHIL